MEAGNWRFPIRWAGLGLVATCLAAAGCGGGSGDASKLLQQTFGQTHRVNSGQLSFSVSIRPSGSAALKSPLSLSLGGPFQSLGKGKLPQSDFSLSLNAFGRSISFGILSTGTSGFVSFEGTSYPLPPADFQKLESSFASLASSPGGSRGSGILGKLGIHPLSWLRNPRVVGDETVQGAATTHIRAQINVAVLLHDFNRFLAHAASLGVSGASTFPTGLSAATINRLSTEIQNPSFDVWTGKSDQTIHKLLISLSSPVPAQVSTLFGSRAGLTVEMQYSHINQPQTITAPTNLAPFSKFTAKIRSFISGLLGAAVPGGASSSGGGGASSSSTINKYAQCIHAAGNDVSKMQQCASLLSTK